MKTALLHFEKINQEIIENGTQKRERQIVSPQGGTVVMKDGQKVINLCSNNYLGLCNHPQVIKAAKESYESYGYGLSSVRFICGTLDLHKQLEEAVSQFLGTQDTILYSSCFDANAGLFETLLTEEDAVISDQLNHASIIDGIRLCKARRYRYENNNMAVLRDRLIEAKDARIRLIATDGVFSMDGTVAKLREICDLAEEFDALVMVDDSHAVGVMGDRGRGTPEHCGVLDRVDILTGTFGKALGGASGGYTSGKQEIIDLLRQRSRPYLFSNTLAPAITAASLAVLKLIDGDFSYRERLFENTTYFSKKVRGLGFEVGGGDTPILPIMLYDEQKAAALSEQLLLKGIHAVAFSYPVVPKGKARIRTQISADLTKEELDQVIEVLKEAKL